MNINKKTFRSTSTCDLVRFQGLQLKSKVDTLHKHRFLMSMAMYHRKSVKLELPQETCIFLIQGKQITKSVQTFLWVNTIAILIAK